MTAKAKDQLILHCVKCEKTEEISIEDLILSSDKRTIQSEIANRGWKLTKIEGGEGYCCPECGPDQVSTG